MVLIVRTPPAFRPAVADKGLADIAFAGMMSPDTVSAGSLGSLGTAGVRDSVVLVRR